MPVSLHPEMLKQRVQRGPVVIENFRLITGEAREDIANCLVGAPIRQLNTPGKRVAQEAVPGES